MDREHLIAEGDSSPTSPSSFMDGSHSPPISAFEIRFSKHRMNETKVELLDPDSNQRKIPLPFQKRDKIRSSMEFDKCRKIDLNVTPTKDFRPVKPTKLVPMPSPSSTLSSSDTESKGLDSNSPGNHFGSVSSKKSAAIPFDEIVIPTVYKRMKMNGEVFGDEGGEDRMALADIWYGQSQGTTCKGKVEDSNKREEEPKIAAVRKHHNDSKISSNSNNLFDGDLSNGMGTTNHQLSNEHHSRGEYTSHISDLNQRGHSVNKNRLDNYPVDSQTIHLKDLRETMVIQSEQGSEKHLANVDQTNTRPAYDSNGMIKETSIHTRMNEPPQKAKLLYLGEPPSLPSITLFKFVNSSFLNTLYCTTIRVPVPVPVSVTVTVTITIPIPIIGATLVKSPSSVNQKRSGNVAQTRWIQTRTPRSPAPSVYQPTSPQDERYNSGFIGPDQWGTQTGTRGVSAGGPDRSGKHGLIYFQKIIGQASTEHSVHCGLEGSTLVYSIASVQSCGLFSSH
ncbi:hypothetical protein K493DRAFT_303050 [Basidiobolus meristosporus CBS 931.73]|uniref:Uncharacterized protein n=1 Tax=Basidiobolus meristosporus CBS 931.73 TaxID=1314790 RepID=A0A1Y1Y4I8_9FUNG|nr:hypothetical protein K493DRAFT_303050 [Basidiobolus meristosporus CBS 931.73]|eukprot:ORX92869.1 hypothetical protein K493DRAFT_303050 [Basidiobolus meristosporus CBS 931.73]